MKHMLLAATVMCGLTTGAQAAPVTYTFTGTVTQLGQNTVVDVSVGSQVPIFIVVEQDYPGNPTPNGAAYGSFGAVLAPTVQVLGADLSGFVQSIEVFTGSSFVLNTVSQQTAIGLSLTLSGALPGVLPDGSLPTTLDPAQFTGGTFAVTELFSADFTGYSGTINGLAAVEVPEPASLVLLAFGAFGIAALRRRVL